MSGPGSPRNGSPELTIEPGATIVELRERIDAVDAEIVRLLSARSRYGYAIASIRKAGDAGARDRARESERIASIRDALEAERCRYEIEPILRLFRSFFEQSERFYADDR